MAEQTLVNGSYGAGVSSTRISNYVYPECGSSSVYLHLILNMVRIFKKINKYIRRGIDLLVRLLLGIVYFILLFPFAIFVKLCTDFLRIKQDLPHWIPHKRIENVKEFLTKQ